jgi:hypothetical protein
MVKKLAYILIFTILFIEGALLVFFMGSQQMVLKAYISLKQRSSETTKLDTFYFSQTTFDSLKIDAKEFRLAGEMYDIESTVFTDTQVEVIAHKDNFENKVLSFIDGLQDTDPQNSSIPSLIKKITSLVFIIEQGPVFHYCIKKSSPHTDFCYSETFFKEVFLEVIKPPCNS